MSKSNPLSIPSLLKLAARFCLIAVMSLSLLIVAFAPRQAYAQTQSFHYDQYNSDITVNKDGSLDVTETLVYVYDEGRFHRGSRAIPLDKTEGITNVQVAEVLPDGSVKQYQQTTYDPDTSTTGVPGTFGTINDGCNLR